MNKILRELANKKIAFNKLSIRYLFIKPMCKRDINYRIGFTRFLALFDIHGKLVIFFNFSGQKSVSLKMVFTLRRGFIKHADITIEVPYGESDSAFFILETDDIIFSKLIPILSTFFHRYLARYQYSIGHRHFKIADILTKYFS